MNKIITIGEKQYNMKASAYTQFKYKNDTGRKLMQDIKRITEIRTSGMDVLEDLDELLEILLQLTYVMIEEADPKQVGSFDQFLKETTDLFEDESWINDVVELAVTPLRRGNKKNPQQINN